MKKYTNTTSSQKERSEKNRVKAQYVLEIKCWEENKKVNFLSLITEGKRYEGHYGWKNRS